METEDRRNQPLNLHSCNFSFYGSKSTFVMSDHVRLHGTKLKTDKFVCDSKAPEMLECGICDFATELKVNLNEHFRVFHEGKKPNDEMGNILNSFQCRNGDFETFSLLMLYNHQDNCNRAAGGNKQEITWFEHAQSPLKTARKLENSEILKNEKLVNCKWCSFQTKYKSSLKSHVSKKHSTSGNIQKPLLNCAECSFKTKQKISLRMHITTQHLNPEDVKWFECAQCGFKTKLKIYLKSHILNKHLKPEDINWFKCTKCSFRSKQQTSLKMHFTTQHLNLEEVKWFECAQCGFKTKLKVYLKSHILNKHLKPEEVNWFKCVECSFKAKQKSSLKIHFTTQH